MEPRPPPPLEAGLCVEAEPACGSAVGGRYGSRPAPNFGLKPLPRLRRRCDAPSLDDGASRYAFLRRRDADADAGPALPRRTLPRDSLGTRGVLAVRGWTEDACADDDAQGANT